MMKYSKALKALIDKVEKETQILLTDVKAGKLDKHTLETGLRQVEKDVKQMNVFNHRADADDES
ncbi:MAG: hypothetical protein WA642_07155 [Steroidobacteraceae bacterium]